MAKILVIDDSPSALALIDAMLAKAGHTVISCLSSREAMTVLAQNSMDLIITDVYMPEKDGLEVMAEARGIRRAIPVVVVSGARDGEVILRAARLLGAVCTLRKPFSEQQLIEAIHTAMADAYTTGLPSRGVPVA